MSAPAGRPEAQAGRNAPPATTSSGNTGRPRARRSQQRSMLQVRRPVRCNRRKHPNKTMGGFMHLQSRPDFIGLERMGNVYFVVFQARNAPAGRGGKTQSAVFPKARCFRDGIRRETAVPSCLSNENFPRHPRNCCFFGIL